MVLKGGILENKSAFSSPFPSRVYRPSSPLSLLSKLPSQQVLLNLKCVNRGRDGGKRKRHSIVGTNQAKPFLLVLPDYARMGVMTPFSRWEH
jgi:hypothetical protein